MDVREKLVELFRNAFAAYGDGITGCTREEFFADFIACNGATVQERKPLEVFLHPIDAYKGLKAKYLVFNADTGAKVENCFVLRPGKDPAAVEALRTYASTTDNEILAEDIYNWVGKAEPVQECGYEFCLDDCCPEFEAAVETNADRIRSMSDEELAEIIFEAPAIPCDIKISAMMKENNCNDCASCIMEWLKQPAEGKKDG